MRRCIDTQCLTHMMSICRAIIQGDVLQSIMGYNVPSYGWNSQNQPQYGGVISGYTSSIYEGGIIFFDVRPFLTTASLLSAFETCCMCANAMQAVAQRLQLLCTVVLAATLPC